MSTTDPSLLERLAARYIWWQPPREAEDLLAHELKVLLQRVEGEDYLDIAALLDSGLDLAYGLSAARLLFGANFQPSEALKAMTWFDGGDLHTLPTAVRQTLIGHAAQPLHLPASMLQAETLI